MGTVVEGRKICIPAGNLTDEGDGRWSGILDTERNIKKGQRR